MAWVAYKLHRFYRSPNFEDFELYQKASDWEQVGQQSFQHYILSLGFLVESKILLGVLSLTAWCIDKFFGHTLCQTGNEAPQRILAIQTIGVSLIPNLKLLAYLVNWGTQNFAFRVWSVLDEDTRLVACTIFCESAYWQNRLCQWWFLQGLGLKRWCTFGLS